MAVWEQIAIIYAATQKYLLDIPTADILAYEKELIELINTKYPEVFESIKETKELSKEMEETLIKAIEEAKTSYKR